MLVHTLRPAELSWSLVSSAVIAITCVYCPAPFRLLHWASMSNSETTLERCQQREISGKTMAAETRTKEPLHCTTCTLLPCSCSLYDALHLPGYYKFLKHHLHLILRVTMTVTKGDQHQKQSSSHSHSHWEWN